MDNAVSGDSLCYELTRAFADDDESREGASERLGGLPTFMSDGRNAGLQPVLAAAVVASFGTGSGGSNTVLEAVCADVSMAYSDRGKAHRVLRRVTRQIPKSPATINANVPGSGADTWMVARSLKVTSPFPPRSRRFPPVC